MRKLKFDLARATPWIAVALTVGCAADAPIAGDDPEVATTAQALNSADYMLVGLGGKCMDIAWGASDDGTQVNLFDCNGTPAQRWHYDAGAAQFQGLGKCLDVSGAVFVDRSHLQIWGCNGGDAQRFRIDSASALGDNVIRPSASTGFCVEVAGGFTDNWTPVQLFDCNSTASQFWHFARIQTPDTAPPAPTIRFSTEEIRDHRGGVVVVTTVDTVEARDQALFENGVHFYERVNLGAWTLIGTTPARPGVDMSDAVQRPDTSASNLFEFKVAAFNAVGETDSSILTIDHRPPPPPTAPSNVRFSSIQPHQLVVAWNDNSSNETGFRVTHNGITNVTSANATSLTITGLAPSTQVCFDVVAINAAGSSSPAHGCATTAALTTRTVTMGLDKFITAQGGVYYFGTQPLAGTLRRIHVPIQSPVTDLLFLKANVSLNECLNPQPGNYVETPPGGDVNLTALTGSPAPPLNGISLWSCAYLSQLVNVSSVIVEVTYEF